MMTSTLFVIVVKAWIGGASATVTLRRQYPAVDDKCEVAAEVLKKRLRRAAKPGVRFTVKCEPTELRHA